MRHAVQDVLAARSERSQRRQQQIAATVAVLLHALVVTAAFAVPRLTREPVRPIEYVEVRVLPPQALGVDRPASEPEPEPPRPTPEPEPDPEPERDETPSLPPPETPPPEQEPDPEPEPAPARSRATERERPGDAGSTEPEGSPEGTPGGTSRLGAEVVGADGGAFPYDYYLDRMLSQIHRNWRRPPIEGVRTVVSFRVQSDGEITEIDVRQSSGSRSFDLAAVRALRNTSPLPPLPASYRQGSLTVNLIVR